MFKPAIKNLANSAMALLTLGTVAQANKQYIDAPIPNKPIQISKADLPAEIKIPDGNIIIEAEEITGNKIDSDHFKNTGETRIILTGDNYRNIITVPDRYKDIPNLNDHFSCGTVLLISENKPIPRATRYVSQTLETDNPEHKYIVKNFDEETLSLAKEFLESNSLKQCLDVITTEQFMSAMVHYVAPTPIR